MWYHVLSEKSILLRRYHLDPYYMRNQYQIYCNFFEIVCVDYVVLAKGVEFLFGMLLESVRYF